MCYFVCISKFEDVYRLWRISRLSLYDRDPDRAAGGSNFRRSARSAAELSSGAELRIHDHGLAAPVLVVP